MGIEFEEDNFDKSVRSLRPKKIRGITGLMIKKGWVKTKNEATWIFVIIIIIGLIASILVYNRTQTVRESRMPISITEFVPQEVLNKIPKNILIFILSIMW